MQASLGGWTEILQIYAAYLAQRSSETGAVSGVLVYTITSVAKGGILSRRTILPTPTVRMSPRARVMVLKPFRQSREHFIPESMIGDLGASLISL